MYISIIPAEIVLLCAMVTLPYVSGSANVMLGEPRFRAYAKVGQYNIVKFRK